MADIRPFLDVKLHVTVSFKSRCKNCKTLFKKKIYDYGILKYKELEQKGVPSGKCGFTTLSTFSRRFPHF